MFLDMLVNYEWDRFIYIVFCGGDLNIGICDYLCYDGMVYKFMFFKTENICFEVLYMDMDKLYFLLMEGYCWGRMEELGVLLDYYVIYLFLVQQVVRQMYFQVVKVFILEGKMDKAEKIFDRGMEIMKCYLFNYVVQFFLNEVGVMEIVELYYFFERLEKVWDIAVFFLEEIYKAIGYFLGLYKGGFFFFFDVEFVISIYVYMNDILKVNGDVELFEFYLERIETFFKVY